MKHKARNPNKVQSPYPNIIGAVTKGYIISGAQSLGCDCYFTNGVAEMGVTHQ